ncbi:hypothetical protein EDB83DRAFT_2242945 [Lactarius deliciosus]|nr:hypothetical protein EDB83DRAFT_2242945 [Lactarius deliciosus]
MQLRGTYIQRVYTLNGTCSNLVPNGTGYENVSLTNQVCGSVVYSRPKSRRQSLYPALMKLFHIWRGYGVIVGFYITFVAALLLFTEYNTHLSGEISAMLFKQGEKALRSRGDS